MPALAAAPGETAAPSLVPLPQAGVDAPAPPPPPAPDDGAIVPRLQSAVARVLPAIEATVAKLAAGPMSPHEMERAARALSSLTRTLRELNGLLARHKAPGAAEDDDPVPDDIDDFRAELARRIENFVAEHAGETYDSGEDDESGGELQDRA